MQEYTYFFLFLLQNIDCGYSLEPPQRRVPTIYVLSKNKKNIFKNPMKFSIFTGEKNLCILHGQVFIMPLPACPFISVRTLL